MGLKIKAGCGISKILVAGYGMKLSVAGPGYVPVRSRDVGCFEIEGGMRDHIRQKRQENAT